MYDFLLLPEVELSCLDKKQQYLWRSVRRIVDGESTIIVATELIESRTLTKQELRAWAKWLKTNKPKLKTRPIDVFRGKIHRN